MEKKSTTAKKKKSDRAQQINQLEHTLIIFILKNLSSESNPLSAAKIADYMSSLTGEEHSDKTILRKLNHFLAVHENADENLINYAIWLALGGHIVELSNKNKKGITKKQSRFYFKPLLTDSDLSMICGAIASNRYLSAQEKEYLLSREQTLGTCADEISFTSQLESMEKTSYLSAPKSKSELAAFRKNHELLHHVNQLFDAIEEKYMIEIIYGVYDIASGKDRIAFHARNPEKPYRLNPYAMLWNNGAFYLLATHNGHDNPVHFRVDRIMSVKPITLPEDATQKHPCAPVPENLKPFFKIKGKKKQEFLVEKYTSTYPLMGIYDDANLQDCCIECTTSTLSILIDTFGTNLQITPSPLKHSPEELDFHGKPQTFLAVKIRNVQYDNVLQFCLQQHTSITAISPEQLVQDVQNTLVASAAKYKKLIK